MGLVIYYLFFNGTFNRTAVFHSSGLTRSLDSIREILFNGVIYVSKCIWLVDFWSILHNKLIHLI